jgi:hypothetical protein
MADDRKNVFISHVHEDDAGLEKTKDLLKKHGLEIRDSSINSSNPNDAKSPEYIKSLLAAQITWASTLLVYITPKTKTSEWVDWEIQYAQKQGKRIVGVWAHGYADCDIPNALSDYHDAVVCWNAELIIDAINGKDISENLHGRACASRSIRRYSCG